MVIECAEATDGMGHSLAAAVREAGDASGWVIALGDMPRVATRSIDAVIAALKAGARIALPTHHGERGHPVGFAASLREDLLALRGDAGARGVLQRYAAEVVTVEVDDPGILQDVDTHERPQEPLTPQPRRHRGAQRRARQTGCEVDGVCPGLQANSEQQPGVDSPPRALCASALLRFSAGEV